MRRCKNKMHPTEHLDLTNFIDMVLFLLIFFLLTSNFDKEMQLDLQRPSASSATTANAKAIKVYIDKYEETYLDNEPVKIWTMQGKLRDLLKVSTQKSILVVTDEGVKAQKLIEVVDQCKLAGAKDVAVSTQKEGV